MDGSHHGIEKQKNHIIKIINILSNPVSKEGQSTIFHGI